jgi:hypothetical protein
MTPPKLIATPYCWLIDKLEQHPVATALVTSVGNILGALALGNWVDWKVPLLPQWKRFLIGGVLTIASTGVLTAVTQRTKTMRQRRETRKAIKKLLWMLAAQFGFPEKHVRTNVTLCSKDKTRRYVDKGTACNMDGDTDGDLSMAMTTGVSGLAVTSRAPALVELTEDEYWGLTAEEDAKVRKTLKTILSVPIFHGEDGQVPELLGTLQVDSDLTKEELGLDEGSIKIVERYADVCALHLRIL